MKRKALALLMSSAMIAAVVTGCSSKTTETEKQTEVKTEAAVETEAATEAAAEETEAVTEAAEVEETEAVTEVAEVEETEAVTEAAETEEAEETEAVTEAAETEEAEETEAVTEAAETEEAEETEAVTEAAEAEEAEETEAVTEAAEAEEAEETEAVTESAETEEAEETEAVTEAPEVEETEAVTEAAETEEAEETEAVTESAEIEEAEETEAVTEAAETEAAEETEAVTEAAEIAEEVVETAGLEEGETYTVGIVQFMDHASLNQIEQAVEEELDAAAEETGAVIEYTLYNGEGDSSTLNQIASQLISDEVDVIVAIATPAAQVVQAVDEDAEIPLIFSAVTDPEGAGLVESNEVPGSYISGTSDALNTETMLKLIVAANPDVQKIGLLYSNSEDSSTVPIQEAKAYLDEQGIEYVEKTGTTTSEISQAVDSLIADGVEAIFTPTDNTVMSAELSIYEKLIEAGVPHYCGADSFALNGAFLGFGVNYTELGYATADMVVETLAGADVSELSVETFDNGIATINTETAEELGFDLDELKEAFAPYCSDIQEVTTAENFE